MAVVSGMWGVATLVGPALGGVFAELDAWRAAFWSLIPVTALFAVLAGAMLPQRAADGAERSTLPWAQLFLLTAAVLAVSAGSVTPSLAWNIAGIVAAVVLTALLIWVETGARQRLLPQGAFRVTAPLGALYATMSLLAVTVTSSEIFVPLFLQVIHQQPPLMAGYLAALMAGGWTLGSITGSGARGSGVSRAIRSAPLLALAGMAVLTVLIPASSAGGWALLGPICVGLVVVGFGVGMSWPHLLTRVLQVAPRDEQGLASASLTTVQLFATALGAALAGMVANLAGLTEPGGVAGTANAACWLFGVFALAPALCILTARLCVQLQPRTATGQSRLQAAE